MSHPFALLTHAATVGVSGSRRPGPASLAALRAALGAVPSGALVCTGCARGIDAATRRLVPTSRLRVFSAARSGLPVRAALAARSVACVRAVASAHSGVWLSFPASACPPGLRPSSSSSACFRGLGSGTWASLAFAVGLGLPAFVFLPPGAPVPAGWPLQPAGSGWWVHRPPQLGLW